MGTGLYAQSVWVVVVCAFVVLQTTTATATSSYDGAPPHSLNDHTAAECQYSIRYESRVRPHATQLPLITDATETFAPCVLRVCSFALQGWCCYNMTRWGCVGFKTGGTQ